MRHYEVRIAATGESFACGEGESVLAAMERMRRSAIPVGCRNGGCGACRIRVVSGGYKTRKMSRAAVSLDDEANGIVLACKVYPSSDLAIAVVGRRAAVSEK